MIRPRSETEGLLRSFNKICETLIKKTRRNPEETIEVILIEPREKFFELSIIFGLDSHWMVGLVSLEVYRSIFKKKQYIIKDSNFLQTLLMSFHLLN